MQHADMDPVAVVSQQGRAVEATKQPAANGLPWLRMLIATLGACALVGIGFGVGRSLPRATDCEEWWDSDVDWEAPPSDGMVVTELNTYEKDGYVFVRVKAGGLEGWGQACYRSSRSKLSGVVAKRVHTWVGPHVLGKTVETPADIDAVTDTAWRQNYKHTGDVLAQVLAGVDTALWDLVARNLNVSVCTLVAEVMGGECKSHMPVYGSNGNRETDVGLLLANAVHNHDKYGVQAFKFQIAQRMGGDVDITPNRTETLIPLARQLLGPEVTLLADANGGYDTIERAKPIAQLLIDNNFTFFEEPFPFWEYDKAAALGAAMPGMPIALGEQEYRMDVWQRNVHAMDVWQPDVHYIGGVSRSLAVARMSMEAGARFVPHSPNPSFVAVFTLHIVAAVPNAFQFMEADAVNTRQPPDGKHFFTEGVLKIKDGKMKVPTGAGWGVALRSDWVDEASKRTSKMKPSLGYYPLFRGLFLICFFCSCYGIVLFLWKRHDVDYRSVLGVPQQHNYHSIVTLSFLAMSFVFGCFALYVLSLTGGCMA